MNEHSIPSTTRVGLKYGFYIIMAYIIISLLFGEFVETIFLFIFTASISFGMLEFRRGNHDSMTYLQGFNLGMIVSTIFGIGLASLKALDVYVAAPAEIAKEKEKMMKNMQAIYNFSDKDLEIQKATYDFMFTPTGAFTQNLLAIMIIGLIVTLIMGLFMRRRAS